MSSEPSLRSGAEARRTDRWRVTSTAARGRFLLGDDSGVSLVEMLVVTGVLIFVVSAVLSVLDITAREAPKHVERGHVVRDGQLALERMTRELRQASVFVSTSSQVVELDTYVRPAGGSAALRRVRYDCGSQESCRRYEGPAGVAGPTTLDGVLVTGVQNADVFAVTSSGSPAVPRYVTVKLGLRVKGQTNALFIHDGVELRNASGS
jgi:Tfp pilus assembly protein PilW